MDTNMIRIWPLLSMVLAIFMLLEPTCAGSSSSHRERLLCDDNKCLNNGTCVLMSHPYGGSPDYCDSGICYKPVFNATDWDGALVACSQINGRLIALDGENELENVYKYLMNIRDSTDFLADEEDLEFWTSGNDLAYEDVWIWALTKTQVSTYNVTKRDNSRQNCLVLKPDTNTISLQPDVCSKEKFFICEIPEQYSTQDQTFQCICPNNFVGQKCEIEQVSHSCADLCPNNETCFKQNEEKYEADFVCECTEPLTMGIDCTETWSKGPTDAHQKTCYGINCDRGTYTSPGYPGTYPNWFSELYLIYIPGAKQIQFTIHHFEIEKKSNGQFADILSIGPGFEEHSNESFSVTNTGSITIYGNSAWIFFQTDRSSPDGFTGFQLNWFADIDRPMAIENLLQSQINISCPDHTEIFIDYAAYGSVSTELLANREYCLNTASLFNAATRCNGLTSCNLQVDVDFTFDPCPKVNKTLNIRYRCLTDDEAEKYELIKVTSNDGNQSCAVDSFSKLKKDYIKPGTYDIQRCPDELDGLAFQQCNNTLRLSEKDLSLCKSSWIGDTILKITDGDVKAIEIAKSINNITVDDAISQDTEGATRDLVQTVRVLYDLVELQAKQLENTSKEAREDVVKQFSETFLKIGSNLLDLKRKDIWVKAQEEGDELSEGDSLSPTSVTEDLENTAFLLASQLSEENDEAVLVSDNIVMGVEVVPSSSEKPITFSFKDFVEGDNNIGVATKTSTRTKNSKKQMIFFLYKTLGELFSVNEEILNLKDSDTEESTTPAEYESTSLENDTETKSLNSLVISASVNIKAESGNDTNLAGEVENVDVEFTLEHTNKSLNGEASCVFWQYKHPHKKAHWSTDGCRVLSSTDTHTTCACTHLTNFAILVDVKGSHSQISNDHELALKWITIIGCSVSIICLGMCIFTFTYFKSLHNKRTMIHGNLCASLLVAEFLFLVGVDKTQDKIVCAVIAGVLHYSFLAAFCWMFLEAVQFYVMLVLVFSDEPKAWIYYLVGYGVPLVVLGATAGSRYDGYGTETFCWLTTEGNMIWSFTGPLAFIILCNFVLLLVALYKAFSARARVAKDATSRQNLKPWIKGAMAMLFLLGCTWGVGFFFLNSQSLFMAYLFTILNSLQGMFIFLFYCIGNERVVTEIRKLIGRQKWLPLWFRERYGPKQKTLTSTTHTHSTDVKQKRAIPSVTVDDGVNSPVYISTPVTQRSWLYSISGTNTLAKEKSYRNPYPEADYT